MDMIFDSAWGITAFLLGFGFIIFVHELGHFAVAKWVGIKVEQFSIGMGHAVFAWRKGIGFRLKSTIPEYSRRVGDYLEANPPTGHADDEVHKRSLEDETSMVHSHEEEQSPYTTEQIDDATEKLGLGETEYKIGWIPIGGYVKMLGQDDLDPEHRSADPRSYNNKPVGARMAVISAGVIMNLIFAMVFFVIAFMTGVDLVPTEVGDVVPGMPAAETYAQGHDGDPNYKGLKPGDIVTEIDDDVALDFSDIMQAAALSATDDSVKLSIQREGEAQPLTDILNPVRKENEPFSMFGIEQPVKLELPKYKDGPPEALAEAGIGSNWRILKANGRAIDRFDQLQSAMNESLGEPVPITFADPTGSATKTLNIEPLPLIIPPSGDNMASGVLGFTPATAIEKVIADSPAAKAGVEDGDILVQIADTYWPTMAQTAAAIKGQKHNEFVLKVLRRGKVVDLGKVKADGGVIGIAMTYAGEPLILADVPDDSPAAALNLPGGSRIDAINGQAVATWTAMLRAVVAARRDDKPIEVTATPFVAGAEPITLALELGESDNQRIADIKWNFAYALPMKKISIQTNNPLEALRMGFIKTRQTVVNVYMTLLRIIDGGVSAKEMRGPLGIGQASIRIVNEMGVTFFIMFLGIISVNLAVINFLPFPVVDGGHMIFLLMEKIKGSPVSVRLQMAATYAGGVVILMVFAFVSYNDVMRLINGG